MEAANDMHFGGAILIRLFGFAANLLQRQGVGPLVPRRTGEGAEGATVDADVGRVDVPVDVEEYVFAVLALVGQGRQFADGQQVVGVEQEKRLFGADALVGADFRGYVLKVAHGKPSR